MLKDKSFLLFIRNMYIRTNESRKSHQVRLITDNIHKTF